VTTGATALGRAALLTILSALPLWNLPVCVFLKVCSIAIALFASPAAAQETTAHETAVRETAAHATAAPESLGHETPAQQAPAQAAPAQEVSPLATPAPENDRDAAQAAAAVAMKSARIAVAEVDWDAARAALVGLAPAASPDTAAAAPAKDPLQLLNAATDRIFPKIASSTVPVLLPFDTAAFERDQAGAAGSAGGADATTAEADKYLAGFRTTFFFPGPSGYDAAFSLQAKDRASLDIAPGKRLDVQISGLAFVYELDGPTLADGSPVHELESEFPGIRRLLLENRLRYAFVRFGVTYVVTIECIDGGRHRRWLSCREANELALRFLKALHIAGGMPQETTVKPMPAALERPDKESPDFTYYAPGDILPGTGMRSQSGRTDATVYANVRFPMAQAPAYINSQSFGNWGNCDFTGRVALGGHGKDATYRCRVNGIPLVHNEAKNYAYPWRDNFCEHRYFFVSQCPAGLGHQGEDIRPGSCKLRNEGADRCEPYQHDVVAASDGVALRSPGDEAIYLVVNQPGEHVRARYLHMNPHLLDAAGIVSGRKLAAGEVIGLADDYGERQGGTTYHLHFDLQVPTRVGYVYVNPYMTLVAAYERLIGGRGRLVSDVGPAANSSTTTTSNPLVSDANVEAGALAGGSADNRRESKGEPNVEIASEARSGRSTASAEHCKTRFVKGHRRRLCSVAAAGRRTRARHAHAVPTVDRRVSPQGHVARHNGGNLHARHERARARHGRA
jgi:hypothetical protein